MYLYMMKNNIDVPIPKVEDTVAAKMRRENYALSRDQQALEFNEAIVKRLKAVNRNDVKCIKCGKVFSAGTDIPDGGLCPECR
jgi:hypothetical protein